LQINCSAATATTTTIITTMSKRMKCNNFDIISKKFKVEVEMEMGI